jgi:UV damage endonuclease UvdE
MEYFNKTQTDWRISQCCQFHDTKLAKRYNFGATTKTYALKEGGKAKVQSKAIENCRKLLDIISTYFPNQPHNLRSFRISSELFPCYTLDFTRDWYAEIWPTITSILERVGQEAKHHEVRLSVHPGQFTVLGSNNADVVRNSIADLEYHALYGKLMSIPARDFVMNIHLQGLYGGKHEDGIKRFATNYAYLSDYSQQCLAVENEDKHKSGYDIVHVIELSKRIPIRVTFDLHHYECMRKKNCEFPNVRDNFFKEAVNSWGNSRPLFHVSQTILDDNGNDGARMNQHSNILHDTERLSLMTPMLEYADFDIEAKHKEVAVNHAYRFFKEEEKYAGEPLICKTFLI